MKEPVANPAQLVAWALHWSVQAPPSRRQWLCRALVDWATSDGAPLLLSPATAGQTNRQQSGQGWGFIEGVEPAARPALEALRADLARPVAGTAGQGRTPSTFADQGRTDEKIRLVVSHLWSLSPSVPWSETQSFTEAQQAAKSWDKALLLGNKEGRANLEDTEDVVVFDDESRWVQLMSQDACIAESAAQDHDYDQVPYGNPMLQLMSLRNADGFSVALLAWHPESRLVQGIWAPGYDNVSPEIMDSFEPLLERLGAVGVLAAEAMPREWLRAHVRIASMQALATTNPAHRISPAVTGMVMH